VMEVSDGFSEHIYGIFMSEFRIKGHVTTGWSVVRRLVCANPLQGHREIDVHG
jgi:hypothetical protein